MKVLVIRQSKSLYNQQNIKNFLVKFFEPSDFSIKEKGKRSYTIFFKKPVSSSIANHLSKKMGLDITYQSNVRCVLTDAIDF